MSDEEKSIGESAGTAATMEPSVGPEGGEEHTTVPNPPQAPANPQQWTMPKPVFKQTSGYLPQGYLKDMQETARTHPDAENTTREQSPISGPGASRGPDLSAINLTAPSAAVEPQPELSEEVILDEPMIAMARKDSAKGGTRVPMFLLGLIAFAAFIAVFLAAVYFLFIKGNGDTSPF